MNLLVLSPHRGDAALALGLAIKKWLARGHRVTVLGVFTRSLSAPYSDADTVHPNDRLTYVSAIRRREDAEFLKLMPGLQMVDLNLKDAVSRLRCHEEDVYTLAPSPEDTAIPKIQKALARFDAETPIDAILLPLGLGHHVDHLVVRNAALEFAAGRPVAFYDDMNTEAPSSGDGHDTVVFEADAIAMADTVGMNVQSVILENSDTAPDKNATMKRKIVSVYASQFGDLKVRSASELTLHYGGGERVWVNDVWIKKPELSNS